MEFNCDFSSETISADCSKLNTEHPLITVSLWTTLLGFGRYDWKSNFSSFLALFDNELLKQNDSKSLANSTSVWLEPSKRGKLPIEVKSSGSFFVAAFPVKMPDYYSG